MTQISKINGIPISNTSVSGFTYDGVNTLTISETDGTSHNAIITNIGGGGSITGGTNLGSASNVFYGVNGSNLEFNTISGTSNYKITTAVVGNQVQVDINEPNMTLWPLVVQGNTLISGGATYLSGLTFSISDLSYIIGATIYASSATTVTLTSGDTSFDRIDVIYADSSSLVGVVEGTPSSNPSKPTLDSGTQVEVTFVTVPANSAEPNVTVTKIYDEALGSGGGEWDFTTATPSKILSASTVTSFSGSKSIEFVSAVSGDNFDMDTTPSYDISTDNTLTFYIKNKVAWDNKKYIDITLNISGSTNGIPVKLDNGLYGFDDSNITTWQTIAIPLGAFNMSSNLVNNVNFEVKATGASSGLEFYLDLIRFQSGAATSSPQNLWLSFITDDDVITTADSNTSQLRLSGGTNMSTRIVDKTVIFDVDQNPSFTTVSGGTFYGDGSNLSGIVDNYVTGSTFNDTIITLNRNNGLSGITTDLTGINIETYFLKDSVGTINVGEVVYAKNWDVTNNVVTVELADATTAAGTMPAIGICTVTGSSTVLGSIITNGTHDGFDTSSWLLNDSLYVSEITGELTNVRPTGATQVQTIGKVLKVDVSNGVIGVYGAGRSNDIPNLTSSKFWVGDTNGVGQETTIDDLTLKVPLSNDYLLIWDTSTSLHKKVIFSGVSQTTGSNLGGGEGVFAQKNGSLIELKSLTSSGSTIGISSDGDTINLESLTAGFTGFNISGDTGSQTITNGNTIYYGGGEAIKTLVSATDKVTIDLNITGTTAEATPISGDKLIIYDTSSGTHKNIDWDDLPGAGGGETNTASNIGVGFGLYKQKVGVDLEFRSLSAGTNVTITTGDTLVISSTGGGSSRIEATVQTTNATITELDKIDTLTDNTTNIVEVYVKAYETAAAEYGVWKRTLTVTSVGGTVVIREENADVDKTSSGLNANSITFTVNGGDIDIDVTGIAATTIDWESAYEIIL